MANPIVRPGEIVDVRQLGAVRTTRQKTSLVKTANVEIIHLVLPAGEEIPTYAAQGEIIFHCLEGQISVSALGRTVVLTAGHLFYYHMQEPFSIQGIERASLLITVITPKEGPAIELIGE